MKINNQRGFTLIELLVVIVVISILVALTLPNLFSAQQRGRDTQRKNDVKNVQQQLEAYYNDNNRYPVALADLSPDYLATVPNDPQGAAYTYAAAPAGCDNATTDCDTYTLTADLENDNDPDADAAGNYVLNSVNQ